MHGILQDANLIIPAPCRDLQEGTNKAISVHLEQIKSLKARLGLLLNKVFQNKTKEG